MEDARYRQLSRLVQFWHPEKCSQLHPQPIKEWRPESVSMKNSMDGLNEYRSPQSGRIMADGEFAEQWPLARVRGDRRRFWATTSP